MNNDVLSFVKKPSFAHVSTVHDRLYNDFSIRNHEVRIKENKLISLRRKVSPVRSTTNYEETLKKQKIHSESNLKKLKARYEAEEIKELRPYPRINKNSQQIASQFSDKSSDSKTNYVISIISNSRFSKMIKNAPIKTPKAAMIKLEDPESIPYWPSQSIESLKKYKEIVNSRSILLHPEDQPSIQDPNIKCLNQDWISNRIAKLQTLKYSNHDISLNKNRLTPESSQKLSRSICSSRAQSVSLSYSDLYKLKKLKQNELDKSTEKKTLGRSFSSARQKN